MSGTGSITIDSTNPNAIVTLDYEANDPPTLDTNAGVSFTGGAVPITTSELSASDPDDDASEVTFAITSGPSEGEILVGGSPSSSFTQQDLVDGLVEYNQTGSGDDSFTFDVEDPIGPGPTGETFAISANEPPTAADDDATTDEDTDATIDVLANDNDPDGNLEPGTVTVQSAPSNGTATENGDGTITYSPNADFSGDDSFEYTVEDNDGATSNTATVSVTVNEVNDPPTATDDSDQTDEDQPVTTDVLANDSDGDGSLDASTVAVQSGPSDGATTVENDGSITYTPDGGFTGTDTYTYTVADDDGATSNVATVTITVGAVNGPPTATDDALTTEEDSPASASAPGVLGNDSDPDGDDLTVSAVNGNGGDVGTQITLSSGALLTLNADGSYTYDPNGSFEALGAGESGSDSFTYTAADGNGAENSATVSVTVNGVNDAPATSDDAASTSEDQPVTVDVLANDSDPEGALAPSTVAVQSGPSNGGTSVDATSGAVTYTPDTGFSGDDTFTYTVEDAAGAVSNPSTVTISVGAVNDAPEVVASIPDRSMEVGAPALQVTSLLATVFQDPEGDPLTLSVSSSDPSVLTASVDGQTIRLDPQAVGSADVTVSASDGTSSTSADPFTVTVAEGSGNEMPSERAMAVIAPTASGGPTEVKLGTTGLGAAFENVQSSGAFDVDFFPGDTGAAATTAKRAAPAFVPGEQFANVSRYRWQMQAPGVTFDSVDVRFRLADADIAGVGDPASITIIRDANGDGDFETVPTVFSDAGTPSDSTDDVLIARGLTTFGTFHLASNSGDNPLPVELTAWTATVDGSAALLQWRTASETNNAGFEVLHQRPDARTYNALGFVEGAGTTQEPQSYRFRAGDLTPGTHRFQLRQVDTDGTATRSEPVTVTIEAERALTLQATGPNPVRQATRFAFTVPQSGPAEVVLYNVLGQRVRTLYAETATVGRQQTVALAVQDLPSGTYFVRLSAPGGTRTQRIVVVR